MAKNKEVVWGVGITDKNMAGLVLSSKQLFNGID
jgi:hypothetical protein